MKESSPLFDLVVLWDWEYDDDFVVCLLQTAKKNGLKAIAFGPGQMEEFVKALDKTDFFCRLCIDRASDVHPGLAVILAHMKSKGTFLINDPQAVAWCRDKATMHLELLNKGVSVPYGIIVSTKDHPESMAVLALEKLGAPFVIKPSEGGGGEGVVLNAVSEDDITSALHISHTGKVILQEKVIPKMIGSHRGWFRVFYLLGKIIPCWWDDLVHIYSKVQSDELDVDLWKKITEILNCIAKTSHMDFFTTEIAIDQKGNLLVVDFVNEMCDMRIQSRHRDGIPDEVFHQIVITLCFPWRSSCPRQIGAALCEFN